MENLKLYLNQDDILWDFCAYSKRLFASFIAENSLVSHVQSEGISEDAEHSLQGLRIALGGIYEKIVGSINLAQDAPILKIFSRLSLTEFEQFMLIYLLALEGDMSLARAQESAFPKVFGKKELASLYYQGHGNEADFWEDTHSFSPQGDFLFVYEKTGVTLSPSLLSYIFTKDFEEKENLEVIEPLILYEDSLARITQSLANRGDKHALLCLSAPKAGGKKHLTKHVAKAMGKDLLCLNFATLCTMEKEEFLLKKQEIFLFTALADGIVYLRLQDKVTDGRDLVFLNELLSFIHTYAPICILGTTQKEYLSQQYFDNYLYLELPPLRPSEKIFAWTYFSEKYAQISEISPKEFGNKYHLSLGEIKMAFESAHLLAENTITKAHVEQGIKMRGDTLEGAQRMETDFLLEDLIVEDSVSRQLLHMMGQLRHKDTIYQHWGFDKKIPYGRGISALFYGPPGTGKTMTASVIANELGLDLYRVDLSKLVSKYIGETEKNISALFQKARSMNVVLFFDEADALFSKRTEVRDANDKNANAESAHLLQQLESYEGVSILATNLFHQLDDAFRRRIKFMIPFTFPDKDTRKRLWLSALPPEDFLEDAVAVDFFAKEFELNGSQIKEVILNSAFMAVSAKKKLGNEEIIEALKLNYQKYGKRLSDEDFGYLL